MIRNIGCPFFSIAFITLYLFGLVLLFGQGPHIPFDVFMVVIGCLCVVAFLNYLHGDLYIHED
jgi:hypothetical protein